MRAFHGVTRLRRVFVLAAFSVTVAVASACDDEPEGKSAPAGTATRAVATATQTAAAKSGPATVEVTAVDYKFEGLPASIAAGTKLTLANRSTAELHELVAIRIPDSERRPLSELVMLPQEEIGRIFGEAPPETVLIAPPGQSGRAVLGDGTIKQAGRYGLVCFIPTGADPQAYIQAAQAGGQGPPQVPGGPPHVAQGMFAELTVR